MAEHGRAEPTFESVRKKPRAAPRVNETLETSLVTFLLEYRDVAKTTEMVSALKTVAAALESGKLSTDTGEMRDDAEDAFVGG